MKAKLRQKFKVGSYIKINLSCDRVIFGRLMYEYGVGIYHKLITVGEPLPPIDQLSKEQFIFYASIFKSVITKGLFEVIGFQELDQTDIQKIPPSFRQDTVNISDCVIFWHHTNIEKAAKPEECIGLESAGGWNEISLVQRIEDHLAGKKNPYFELGKVVLNIDDPRYLPQPGELIWDFENEKYYRKNRE